MEEIKEASRHYKESICGVLAYNRASCTQPAKVRDVSVVLMLCCESESRCLP